VLEKLKKKKAEYNIVLEKLKGRLLKFGEYFRRIFIKLFRKFSVSIGPRIKSNFGKRLA
jgi:hypothetical protein